MASLKCSKATVAVFTMLFTAKTSGKRLKLDWSNVLSQLKIYSKPVYSYALEVMLSNLKKPCTTRFSSAGITALYSITVLCKTH